MEAFDSPIFPCQRASSRPRHPSQGWPNHGSGSEHLTHNPGVACPNDKGRPNPRTEVVGYICKSRVLRSAGHCREPSVCIGDWCASAAPSADPAADLANLPDSRTGSSRSQRPHFRPFVNVGHREHDQRTVIHHVIHVGTAPALRCDCHQRATLGRVCHHTCGRGDVHRYGLLQVHDELRVGRDVVDPVARPVGQVRSDAQRRASRTVSLRRFSKCGPGGRPTSPGWRCCRFCRSARRAL